MTDISALFPIEITVPQDLIDAARPLNPHRCQGALALRHALGDFANGRDICWGIECGQIDGVVITTKEKVLFPVLKSSTKVTFIVLPKQTNSYEKNVQNTYDASISIR